MSTVMEAFSLKQGWGSGIGRFLLALGLRFTAMASVTFIVVVVILIGLFLANIDGLFAGLLGVPDPVLVPVQDNSGLVN